MVELIVDVTQGSLTSAYAKAPFDEAKQSLEAEGYRIISLEEMARLRVQEGKNSSISRVTNWTREGFIYVPKKGVFLAPNSPIMDNAVKAARSQSNGGNYHLTDEQVEKALADSIKIPFNQKPIPTNRFGDDEITKFVFRESAREYGEFLREAGVSEMSIGLGGEKYVQGSKKPFVKQAWLEGVDHGSSLCGCDFLSFYCGYGLLRGVKDSAEGTGPKNSQVESYTSKQIKEALKRAKLQGIESILLDALKLQL